MHDSIINEKAKDTKMLNSTVISKIKIIKCKI